MYDTRQPGGARLARFVTREVKIPASVIPADATAAVVNLTVDRAAAAGYLTAFPCGEPAPPSSNLNFVAGEARAVAAIVGLGLGSTMCVMSDVAADVIVDVNGYYAPAPQFGPTADLQPLSGTRVLDTRNGIGGPLAPFQAGETRQIDPVALGAGRGRGECGDAQRDRRQPRRRRLPVGLSVFVEPARGVVAQLHGSRRGDQPRRGRAGVRPIDLHLRVSPRPT